tara:strand:+ start:7540 stop:7839 length:300 start_codon:yes stop_codon:yes gene_type:complete
MEMEMHEIERECRELCRKNRVSPDAMAPAEFQGTPGYPVEPGGYVKQWMLWISTVKGRSRVRHDQFEREILESRKTLQRIIDETTPARKPQHKYHTEKR